MDNIDYSEVLRFKNFRLCSVLKGKMVYSSYAFVNTSTAESLDLCRSH